MRKKILIAGGSGFIGHHIQNEAAKLGWDCVVLSRNEGVGKILWDPGEHKIDISEPLVVDAVINLAGESILRFPWTQKHGDRVLKSRVDAVSTIHKYLSKGLIKTDRYVGASAVGYYGDRGEEKLDETSMPGSDFLADIVVKWEEAHQQIPISKAIVRIGLVLGEEGGYLKALRSTFFTRVLVAFGKGDQWLSVIKVQDLAELFCRLVEKKEIEGVVNGVGPEPIRQLDFLKELKEKLGGNYLIIHIPKWVIRMVLGKLAVPVLGSGRVYSNNQQ